ncbi:WD40 repeat domain-containing protein [Streptomyces albus]|uniref:WD40 repeat domain-containing protein n=1 Tax=Streptomyces sp. NRRL F-5639 TaxID=1463867 RepID=UPI003B63260F
MTARAASPSGTAAADAASACSPAPTGKPAAAPNLAFSPDGGTLAVAGRQGTVRLWDTAAHQPLGGPLPTGRDRAVALAFSPDGGELYVAGSRFPVRRYTVAPRRAASRLCARGHGGLTPAQWHAALRDVPYRPTC